MCGRYALGIRASFVRHQLQQQGLPVDEAPADEAARETFNFPPGAYGLVYRANVPDEGAPTDEEEPKSQNYELKVMKWGLIPFWTKRSPDYGSLMKTINCRDDSLIEDRGMWTSMKRRKRCIVVAQGFYEWLKKGKDKVPHFVKRKDGQLMCFAGLWDCVKYEDSEEKLYTYTIITTDSNKQLKFLHDRMPVLLEPDNIKTWLNPHQGWSKELQSLLRPYDGALECYAVNKDVGKVGNNSPDFIIPVDSKDNKKNIANFFQAKEQSDDTKEVAPKVVDEHTNAAKKGDTVDDSRETIDHEGSEDNAPLPASMPTPSPGQKRKAQDMSPGKKQTSKKAKSATSNKNAVLNKSPEKNKTITSFFAK